MTANQARNIGTVLLILGILLMMFGCAAGPMVPVEVPVPVACKEKEPDRPVMPTEILNRGANVDEFVKASIAENKRREGYEVKLVAALRACIAPIDP